MDHLTAILSWMKRCAARAAVGYALSSGRYKEDGYVEGSERLSPDIAQPFLVATMSVNTRRPQRGHIVSATIPAWGMYSISLTNSAVLNE